MPSRLGSALDVTPRVWTQRSTVELPVTDQMKPTNPTRQKQPDGSRSPGMEQILRRKEHRYVRTAVDMCVICFSSTKYQCLKFV